jgi:hypothetical protein
MANQKKTEAVEPISVTTVAAPAAPSADETASQLIGILTQASPELQAQIVQKLSQSSGYNPSAVGQENPAYKKNKKKAPNPSSVVAAFGSVVHEEGFEPVPPSAVTDKDGDPTGKGPHAQAWLRRWHEGNSISARQMTLQGISYGSAEDLAEAARMEFPTDGLTG